MAVVHLISNFYVVIHLLEGDSNTIAKLLILFHLDLFLANNFEVSEKNNMGTN